MKLTSTILGLLVVCHLLGCSNYEEEPNIHYNPEAHIPSETEGWELVNDHWKPSENIVILNDGKMFLSEVDGTLYVSTDSCRSFKQVGGDSILHIRYVNSSTIFGVQYIPNSNFPDFDNARILKSNDLGKSFEVLRQFDLAQIGSVFANQDSLYFSLAKLDSNGKHIYTKHYVSDHTLLQLEEKSEVFELALVDYFRDNDHLYEIRKDDQLIKYDLLGRRLASVQLHFLSPYWSVGPRQLCFSDNGNTVYLLNHETIEKYYFNSTQVDVILDSTYMHLTSHLAVANDTTFFVNAFASSQFWIVKFTPSKWEQVFYYNYLNPDKDNSHSYNIVELAALYKGKYLYLFVNDGNIWRMRLTK